MIATDLNITLKLSGNVTLSLFVEALSSLNDLLAAAGEEVGAPPIEWVVQDLEVGSTIATVQGVGESPEVISQVTGAALRAAMAFETRDPELADLPSVSMVRSLTTVLDGVVPELSLSSGELAVVISSEDLDPSINEPLLDVDADSSLPERVSAIGSLTGIVQMVSHARDVRFSIRDERSGRILKSYVSADQTENLRAAWDKRAVVEGLITRDARSGVPVALADVRRISLAREVPAGAFMRARGILRVEGDMEPPEETIRRLRNAS
jgi:hypothetical protein